MKFMIVYMRAKELDDSIEFEGPFRGNICKSRDEADLMIKDICAKNKNSATIPKIYPISSSETEQSVMTKAKIQFDALKKEMLESQRMLNRKRAK